MSKSNSREKDNSKLKKKRKMTKNNPENNTKLTINKSSGLDDSHNKNQRSKTNNNLDLNETETDDRGKMNENIKTNKPETSYKGMRKVNKNNVFSEVEENISKANNNYQINNDKVLEKIYKIVFNENDNAYEIIKKPTITNPIGTCLYFQNRDNVYKKIKNHIIENMKYRVGKELASIKLDGLISLSQNNGTGKTNVLRLLEHYLPLLIIQTIPNQQLTLAFIYS